MSAGYRAVTLTLSVAAGLAATLALPGCGVGDEEETGLAASEQPAALQTRWLVPPDPALAPPLAAPLAVAVDDERGRLLLLEARPPELRVYGLDGEFRRSLGRSGGGPGEYRRPIDMTVSRRGVAAVLEMSGRVTYWGAGDELMGSVEAGGPGLATEVLPARADSFYVKVERFPPDDIAEFRVVTPDTVLPGSRYRDEELPGTEAAPGSTIRNHSYAVASTPQGDLLLSPPGPDYLIVRIGPGGKVRQIIRRPEIVPLRRSPEEIEAIRERIRQNFAKLGAMAPADLKVPALRSHIGRLAVAPDSTIWALTQRGGDSVAVIDRFEPGGAYAATYTVDLVVSDLAVSRESIYLIVISDDDVPGVAVAARPDVMTRTQQGVE